MRIGIALTCSPFGHHLGFTTLPPLHGSLLAFTLAGYVVLTQAVQT